MARVGLNTLFDADSYPVDLSELMALGSLNHAVARSFLNYCAADPQLYAGLDETMVIGLLNIVQCTPVGPIGEDC